MSVAGSSSSIIHLLHPDSGHSLNYVAFAHCNLDLGTIAAFFSLDPRSVRLNGHFISSDALFVSSLTWSQVLSFFHDRGFGSGADHFSPVLVTGKPLQLHIRNGDRREDFNRDSLELTDDGNGVYEINPRIKRVKQDTYSESPTVELLKRKLWLCEEPVAPDSCSKRSRCDFGNAGTQHDKVVCFSDEKNETVGFKRQLIGADGSNHGPLSKRLKEIRV